MIVNPGNKKVFIGVLGIFGLWVATDAGHRGEDSIQEIWLAAENACRGDLQLAGSLVSLPEVLATPAAVEWRPDLPGEDCGSR